MRKNHNVLLGLAVSILAIIVIYFTYPTENRTNYKTGIQLITVGNFEDANSTFSRLKSENYKNSEVLYAYTEGAYGYTSGYRLPSETLNYMQKNIPANYNGEFSEDIKAFTKKIEEAKANGDERLKGKFTELTDALGASIVEKYNKNSASVNGISSDYPKIGMTSNEVLNTKWGKPKDINKTTTAYGVSEQWVYSSGKYIYLNNDIVTAIQD